MRRAISRLTRSSGLVLRVERVEAEQIGLGVQDELRDPGRDRLGTLDHDEAGCIPFVLGLGARARRAPAATRVPLACA